MGKFDGVLLACDFDNTLVYTEPALVGGDPIPSLDRKNREALEYFSAHGGHFAVATGRALAAFQTIAPELPINTPCVICNGAALYDFGRGEYLDYNLLDETALRRGQTLAFQSPQRRPQPGLRPVQPPGTAPAGCAPSLAARGRGCRTPPWPPATWRCASP